MDDSERIFIQGTGKTGVVNGFENISNFFLFICNATLISAEGTI